MTKTHSELLKNIPAELRTPAKWLQYYLKKNPKKPNKKPSKAPVMKYGTPKERAANLRSLDYLLENREPQAGFQRYVDKEEGFTFIDLDHVRNADTGEVTEWADKLIEKLNTYTEVSASGEGFHIVCRGKLDEDFHVDPNPVEIYSGNTTKLIAMTGDLYDPKGVLCTTVEDRHAEVSQLLNQVKNGDGTALPTEEPKNWRDAFHTVDELDTAPGRVFIKGILEEGLTFFGAHSGVGKTWIGLSIAHALTTGEPLFGSFPVVEQSNVLYLVPEMGARKVRERAIRMRLPRNGDTFRCQTVRDGAIKLDDPLLLQAIGELKPTVILDTAIRFQLGDEQSSTQQATGLGTKMFDLLRAGAAAVICMHHRSKDLKDKEPDLQNTLRGSGEFGAMADCVWCAEHSRKSRSPEYEQESKDFTRLTLTCVKPRDMEPAEPFMIQGRPYINDKGDFVVLDWQESAEEPVSKEGDEKVLELVRVQPSIGILALRKATGFGEARVNRILSDNKIIKSDGLWTSRKPSEGVTLM